MAYRHHWLLACALTASAPVATAQSAADFISVDGFERLQAMRVDTLELRDPHLYAGLATLCTDATDALNASLADGLNGDDDNDGVLDNSPMLLFRPLRIDARPSLARVGSGQCSAPATGTSCQPGADPMPTLAYQGQVVGTCLTPLAGTTRPYDPPVQPAVGTCVVADADGIDLGLGDIAKLLRAPRLAASQRDNPTPGLGNGLLAGFLTETAADALLVEMPVLGEVPLSSLLPGGTSNCASHSDKDEHDGEPGWWFYFNFSASEVPWQE